MILAELSTGPPLPLIFEFIKPEVMINGKK